uniref:Uncharacterized protein n=1 Tax=Ixodes scapularis TaxID=6945 RepID=A0A4D5REB0_IXOSC
MSKTISWLLLLALNRALAPFFVTTLFYFVLSATAAAKGCRLALYLMNIKYETSQELLEVPNGIQHPIVLLWGMGTWHIIIK